MLLLVEDDQNKSRQILAHLAQKFPELQVQVRRSYTSGLKAIREGKPRLVLLDMSLPNFDGEISSSDGGKFRSYGGKDIFHQLARRKVDAKVVIVTAYESFSSQTNAKTLSELSDELALEFPEHFLGTVFYSGSQDEWKAGIDAFVERILCK